MKGGNLILKHIIFWDHPDGLTNKQKTENAEKIKQELEGLNGIIPGLIELQVYTELLDGSDADMVLDSVLENAEALAVYQAHPAHVKAATEVVRPNVKNRRCVDFAV